MDKKHDSIHNVSVECMRDRFGYVHAFMYVCMRVWVHACKYMYVLHEQAYAERCANVMEIMSHEP